MFVCVEDLLAAVRDFVHTSVFHEVHRPIDMLVKNGPGIGVDAMHVKDIPNLTSSLVVRIYSPVGNLGYISLD